MINKKRRESKKSQITVLIIIAIIIVIAIAFLFIFLKKPEGYISPKENPKAYIDKCARDAITPILDNIYPNGGFTNPVNYIIFNQKKVEYYCYTPNNFQLCTEIHPVIKKEIENEIKNQTINKINSCFTELRKQLSNYQEKPLTYSIEILPNQISIKIDKEVSYTQNGQTVTISNFKSSVNSRLFDFLRLSNDIINAEVNCNCNTQSCNPDLSEMNRNNRDFTITKPVYTGTGEEIYNIKEINTGKEFNFALRNCVRQ
jgi:hypothetical protein